MATTACQFCGRLNQAAASTCSNCGAPMSTAGAAPPAGRPAPLTGQPIPPVGTPMPQPGMPQPAPPYGVQPAWGGPPKKSKTGLIVGLIAGGAVVLVIIVVGIVALVGSSGPTTGSMAKSAIADLNAGSSADFYAKFCKPPDSYTKKDLDGAMKGGANLTVNADDSDDDSFLLKDVTGTVNGKPIKDGSIAVQEDGDRQCIEDFLMTLPDPDPNASLATARNYVTAINADDTATMSDLRCPDASAYSPEFKNPSIQVDGVDPSGIGDAEVNLSGREDGYSLDSSSSDMTLKSSDVGKTWCVEIVTLVHNY